MADLRRPILFPCGAGTGPARGIRHLSDGRLARCILAILSLAMVASTGCSPEGARPLTVVDWGGSSQDAQRRAYWIPFSKATGIPLREASWHGGVGVIRARIKSGDDSWDVVSVETEDLI